MRSRTTEARPVPSRRGALFSHGREPLDRAQYLHATLFRRPRERRELQRRGRNSRARVIVQPPPAFLRRAEYENLVDHLVGNRLERFLAIAGIPRVDRGRRFLVEADLAKEL